MLPEGGQSCSPNVSATEVQTIKPEQLWAKEKDVDGSHKTWYAKAVSYWDKQEASYNGVLGGFETVSDVDIRDSQSLLLKVCDRKL